jgi:uncharacterized protein with PQ loop repeat
MDLSSLFSNVLYSLGNVKHWDLFAFLGCAAVETCYLPQLARLYRMKESEEISLIFPTLNVLGRTATVLCLAHLGQSIFAFWITIGLLLRSSFLFQVIYYRWRRGGLERLQQSPCHRLQKATY